MRVLAVSYALPPALYPQAIQIGRLLAHCDGEIGAVCAPANGSRTLDHDFGLDQRLHSGLRSLFSPGSQYWLAFRPPAGAAIRARSR